MVANQKVDELLKTKGPIPGVTWQERGPNNVGGRSRALMFDPNDPTFIKRYGQPVFPEVFGLPMILRPIHLCGTMWMVFGTILLFAALHYNPANTLEFYVGTGEGWFNADAQRGGGIWKTSDGGANLVVSLPGTDPGAYNSGSHFQYVNKIVDQKQRIHFHCNQRLLLQTLVVLCVQPMEDATGQGY